MHFLQDLTCQNRQARATKAIGKRAVCGEQPVSEWTAELFAYSDCICAEAARSLEERLVGGKWKYRYLRNSKSARLMVIVKYRRLRIIRRPRSGGMRNL